eukprot:3722525-Rhodomonas_salina.2
MIRPETPPRFSPRRCPRQTFSPRALKLQPFSGAQAWPPWLGMVASYAIFGPDSDSDSDQPELSWSRSRSRSTGMTLGGYWPNLSWPRPYSS